ncbi:MAG: tRNA lysidine(34) synthetase TilS [Anaerolineales bacterium]|nr:tRNA lysidine(34) synthetase TilS [Anaerolineales bacterium]
MAETIETILRDECGLVKDRPIIVGVSGGPDSLCLMETLRQAGYPIIVAYFDHQLRPESDQDARLVEKTATRLMVSCMIDGADVRAHAEKEKLSIEEAARNLRYKFLFNLARQRNAQAVAVGHTADDQVETVLMHFLRGSAITGLKGMSYRSVIKIFDPEIPIVRPLLDMWREETVVYCAVNGLRPHYDSSNDSLNFQRNRIRHLLIPNLESYNPKFREAVLRMSQSLKGDYAFVMETLENAWQNTVTDMDEDFIIFDADLISKHSLGLQRNLVKHAMQTLRPGLDMTFSVVQRAINLIKTGSHLSRVDLKGGLYMFRESDNIYICTLDAELPFNLWPQMTGIDMASVGIPGQVALAGGWRFNCERWRLPGLAREQSERNEDPFQVWLDAEQFPSTLELRIRHQGDHFSPLGMDGHSQKLSDFFVNEKLPQRARERWPLLCAGDKIIWVPGYRPAHPYRLTSETRNVIYFSVSRPSEKIME